MARDEGVKNGPRARPSPTHLTSEAYKSSSMIKRWVSKTRLMFSSYDFIRILMRIAPFVNIVRIWASMLLMNNNGLLVNDYTQVKT